MKKTIYLAGGCFWGVEAYYKKLRGILDTKCGYANGDILNPRYEDLKNHLATHAEVVQINYDDETIPLVKVLEHFMRIIDPYRVNHQGGDTGLQYRTGVFYEDAKDGETINEYFDNLPKVKPFAIIVEPLTNFYDAEEYHQDYLDLHPNGYCHVDFKKIRDDEKK